MMVTRVSSLLVALGLALGAGVLGASPGAKSKRQAIAYLTGMVFAADRIPINPSAPIFTLHIDPTGDTTLPESSPGSRPSLPPKVPENLHSQDPMGGEGETSLDTGAHQHSPGSAHPDLNTPALTATDSPTHPIQSQSITAGNPGKLGSSQGQCDLESGQETCHAANEQISSRSSEDLSGSSSAGAAGDATPGAGNVPGIANEPASIDNTGDADRDQGMPDTDITERSEAPKDSKLDKKNQRGTPGKKQSDADWPNDPDADFMNVRTASGQNLRCVIPTVGEAEQREKNHKAIPFKQIEAGLDKKLIGKCFDLPNGWWRYQFCYKTEITQIHAPDPNSGKDYIVHSLGKYEGSRYPNPESGDDDGKDYVQIYTDGQRCDETDSPRHTNVVFKCQQPHVEGKRAIPDFKLEEIGICQYRLEFYSEELCKSEEYKQKHRKNLKKIQCRMAEGEGQLVEPSKPAFGSVWDWF